MYLKRDHTYRSLVIFWQQVKKVLLLRRHLIKELTFGNILAKKNQNCMYLKRDHTYLQVNQIVSYYELFFRLFTSIICVFLRAVCYFLAISQKYSLITRYLGEKLTFGEMLSKKVKNCMYLRRDYTYPSYTQVLTSLRK